jgi:hypothetical protein
MPSFVFQTDQPKEYQKEEFPSWMLELRRAEIIAIGAFPFMFLFAGLGYDFYYYFYSGMNKQFAPWPAGPGTSKWTIEKNGSEINQKYLGIILGSAVLSLTVALLDWILGKVGVP